MPDISEELESLRGENARLRRLLQLTAGTVDQTIAAPVPYRLLPKLAPRLHG